jgi:glycosyltransferase involved in cell wall biosynthesis
MSVAHYENFPVASWLLPKGLRPAVRAIYRFARTADDFADEGDLAAEARLAALDRYEHALAAIESGVPPAEPPFPELAAAIARHGLGKNVFLPGSCPHQRTADYYRASDAVVLPSFSEGIPNVLREAVACGKPFVATRVGGIPEIAHPSYSRLVSPGDTMELADALREGRHEPFAHVAIPVMDLKEQFVGAAGALIRSASLLVPKCWWNQSPAIGAADTSPTGSYS